jgi:hypothetical protein
MRAHPRSALRSSSRGIVACPKIVAVILVALAVSSLNSDALRAATAPRYPIFTIKSYLGRCLAWQTASPTLVIADCDNATDQAFGVEEIDADHRVRLHLAEQCVGAESMAEEAVVSLQPCSDAASQIFVLDGDSIILDAKPDLVVHLSNAITKAGTPVALSERWLGDDELWDFVPPAGSAATPTRGFVTASDIGSFEARLAAAGPNSVIQLTPDAELDFQDVTCPFEIPAGVTVRGNRRGTLLGPQFWVTQGHDSNLPCDALFVVDQPRSRISGLRIRGPGRDPKGKQPPMKGISIVAATGVAGSPSARIYLHAIVDHNDISDWGISAIDLRGPDDDNPVCPLEPQTDPGFVRILRNFIHDNRENHYTPKGFEGAEAYGLAAGSGAYPLVFANTFQKNGTSLTSDGASRSGYVAVSNIFLSGNDSADADVHGNTNKTGDVNHDGGIAGLSGHVIGNTFLRTDNGENSENFSLRGLPCNGVNAIFKGNVTRKQASDAVTVLPADGSASDNISWMSARPRVPYLQVDSKFAAPDPASVLLVGNFDGDAKDDVFMATGAGWYYSPGANAEWRFLSAKTETADMVLLGDFDGDGITDVFKQQGDTWYVSWGGRSPWQVLSTGHRVNMPNPDLQPWPPAGTTVNSDPGVVSYVIGDFVGDKRADVFFADGQTWWVSDGGTAPFVVYQTSSFRRADIAFGDFDGSGKTEVIGVVDNQWMFAPASGTHSWTPLRSKLTNTMNGAFAADFNGDGTTDVAFQQPSRGIGQPVWEVSLNARANPTQSGVAATQNALATGLAALPNALAIGRFDGAAAGAEIIVWFGNAFYKTSLQAPNPAQQSRQDMR